MLKAKEIINMIASAFYEIEVTGDHVQQILMNEQDEPVGQEERLLILLKTDGVTLTK